ncbi:hypothetical protein ACHAW6_015379 [Cyclotella cf. meneghiniana]
MRRHQGDNQRRRHSSHNPYQQNHSTNVAPSVTKCLLPVLSRHLGIKTRRQQELFLVGCISVILALWFLTPLSDYCATLILYTVPIESDVALGRKALLSLERKYPRVHDRWGVTRIGSELVNAGTFSKRDPSYRQLQQNPNLFDNIEIYEWDFGVVKAPPDMVNAFALPGGIVRVTDSLLNTLHLTDAELAALLGHEMGHILYRHSQKRTIKNHLLSTIWEAFSYEDNYGYSEAFGEAVAEGLWKSASFLGELAFSRSDEYQADEAAWDLLASTYSTEVRRKLDARQFHPMSVKSLLSKLWKYQGGSGSTSWESTHPGTKDRIDALQKKLNTLDPLTKRRFV